jgi:hypothetical protein
VEGVASCLRFCPRNVSALSSNAPYLVSPSPTRARVAASSYDWTTSSKSCNERLDLSRNRWLLCHSRLRIFRGGKNTTPGATTMDEQVMLREQVRKWEGEGSVG